MPYPSKVSEAHKERMRAALRIRYAPGNTGNKELATELQLPECVVNRWMSRLRREMESNSENVQISSAEVSC